MQLNKRNMIFDKKKCSNVQKTFAVSKFHLTFLDHMTLGYVQTACIDSEAVSICIRTSEKSYGGQDPLQCPGKIPGNLAHLPYVKRPYRPTVVASAYNAKSTEHTIFL